MYEILCDFNKLDDEKIWINIWKLKITERNRCFMWLVKHNRLLLTKQVKSRMGLGSACCDYCGEEETSLHWEFGWLLFLIICVILSLKEIQIIGSKLIS
jgi:hypothetical protein